MADVKPLAPDGRTWLEHSAEWHDKQAATCRTAADYAAKSKGWEDQVALWRAEAEQHDAMAAACREAHG